MTSPALEDEVKMSMRLLMTKNDPVHTPELSWIPSHPLCCPTKHLQLYINPRNLSRNSTKKTKPQKPPLSINDFPLTFHTQLNTVYEHKTISLL